MHFLRRRRYTYAAVVYAPRVDAAVDERVAAAPRAAARRPSPPDAAFTRVPRADAPKYVARCHVEMMRAQRSRRRHDARSAPAFITLPRRMMPRADVMPARKLARAAI